MRKKGTLILILLLIFPLLACNESDLDSDKSTEFNLEEAFSAEEAYHHIEALTGEAMEGRRAGTEGNRRAKEYIKNHFASLGLSPLGDEESYYQWYTQQDLTFTKEASLTLLDDEGEIHKEFTNRKDYILLRRSVSGEHSNRFERVAMDSDFSLESSITLIEEEAMEENSSLEIESPIILAENMEQLHVLLQDHRDEIEGLILLPQDPVSNFTGESLPMYIKPGFLYLDADTMEENTPDVMYITRSTFDEILSLKDQGYTLQAKGGFTHEEVSVANVIGGYESPEDTKDTLLLIAHFDHLGKDSDGSVNPGALDNASGTAVMMEMARVITEENMEIPFNIEFIAFNGEEDGLLGSFHYADTMDHDPEDLKVINLDMVGASDVDYLLIDPSDRVPEESLYILVESILKEKEIDYRLQRNSGGSDHIPFSLKGADVLLLLDYSHQIFDNHYHNHYDTMDIIDQERLGLFGNILLETLQRNSLFSDREARRD
ncbi:M28 family metallopeptidase [Isachenkonia alkalipeptolytica]|uniref:Zn-dependent exopeptidase M28 n=1 Tax=Isachenkonia alkalipeptolytica TaxID=2565777 RepID=A0AA44BDC8_9CLOT|nr:M28 family peptidase [Isachenkonia alkalipeptolytica]NBG88184.1 Zn-dependent exopeptidase M28 [Isachenkonia alkalipeptolytica]